MWNFKLVNYSQIVFRNSIYGNPLPFVIFEYGKIYRSIFNFNGTSAVQTVAPGTLGNVLTSNGTTWISAAAVVTHTVGESFGGGKVFYVTTDGLHGLIAETQDQGLTIWYGAQNLISDYNNHSTAGKLFTDWRLPTKFEIALLYAQRNLFSGFVGPNPYWTSTSSNLGYLQTWAQDFVNNASHGESNNLSTLSVRAIRAF